MNFPRYPEYKQSGVEWLGAVPSHWEVKSIKRLSPVQRGASPRPIDDPRYFDDDGEYAWVRIADVSASNGLLAETSQKMSELGSSLSVKLQPDDLFVSIAGTVGKPCIAKIKVCIHDGFVYFPSLEINKFWLYRIFEAGSCYGGLGKMGTQLNLNTDTIGSIKIAVPPKSEIDKLLQFIDYELKKIDELIYEQEKFINLLKEKSHSIVLDSFNAPDTLMIRLDHVVEVVQRPVELKDNESYEPLGIYNRGRGLFHKEPRITSEMGDSDFFWVKKGDLIFSGQFAWEGSVAMASDEEENCVVSHRYPIIRGKLGLAFSEYLFALFTTSHGDFLLNECSIGAAGRNRPLNMNLLLKEKIPIPNISTQKRIVDIVSQRRDLVIEVSKQRELLLEHRSTFISLAVTGQIDVRNFALALEVP